MRRSLRALSLLCLLLAVGCGTSGPATSVSYDAAKDRTTFRSGTMRVGRVDGGGYGSSTSILMSIRARCTGSDCIPETARLSFQISSGSSQFGISNRSISLVADGTEYAHREVVHWQSTGDIRASLGEIVGLTLSLSELERIANASSLTGELGNNSLDFDEGVKTELRSFVRAARRDPSRTPPPS